MIEEIQEPIKEEIIEEAEEEIIENPIISLDEKQEYIEKYCKQCKKDRVFITSLSPKTDIICTECRHRESIVPFKMVKGQSGYKFFN